MEPTDNTPQENTGRKRPDLLTVLCILTFIGSGTGAFSNLMITMNYDETMDYLKQEAFEWPLMELLSRAGYGFFLTGTLLYSTSLAGAIQMWKMRKIGFHLYLVAQILLLLLPLIYIGDYPFPWFDLLITTVFVYLYWKHVRLMK